MKPLSSVQVTYTPGHVYGTYTLQTDVGQTQLNLVQGYVRETGVEGGSWQNGVRSLPPSLCVFVFLCVCMSTVHSDSSLSLPLHTQHTTHNTYTPTERFNCSQVITSSSGTQIYLSHGYDMEISRDTQVQLLLPHVEIPIDLYLASNKSGSVRIFLISCLYLCSCAARMWRAVCVYMMMRRKQRERIRERRENKRCQALPVPISSLLILSFLSRRSW